MEEEAKQDEDDANNDHIDDLLRDSLRIGLWSKEQLAEIGRDPSHIEPYRLRQYWDGELTPEERFVIDEHKRDCLYCIVESATVLEMIITSEIEGGEEEPGT